ncbi:MAG: acetyltransferase [Glaciihabitans sp.]|nr:acetyltransferase [Glaciihabitans sp.]
MTNSASHVTLRPAMAPAEGQPRLSGLDGLRAIAVLAVILFHLTPGALPGGALGVDIFFVLSGFLITGLLSRERQETGRVSLFNFWRRRARRILPALALLLVVCCSIAVLLGSDVLVGLGTQLVGALTFSSNWLAIASGNNYFAQSTPELFRNLWSLSLEEQFYLVWPLLFLLLALIPGRRTRGLVLLLVAIASATAMALLFTPAATTRVYYGTDTHLFGLAIGALLAVILERAPDTRLGWPRRRWRLLPFAGVLAVAGLVALSILLPSDDARTYRGGLAVVAVLTAIAIAGASVPGSPLGRALDIAPLRWIGQRSYGLYLWHWPVLVLLTVWLPLWPGSPLGQWTLGAAAAAITVAAATFSYRFVETPIRRVGFRATMRGWFGPGRVRTLRIAASITAIAVAVALVGFSTAGILRAPKAGSAEDYVAAGQAAIAAAGGATTQTTGVPSGRTSGHSILAIGDSVMLAAAPKLEQAFPGIAIDAVVSRQMFALPAIVDRLDRRNQLRHTLVVGLGTNGYIGRDTLEAVYAIVGPRRNMIVVNVQAPRAWTPSVNRILEQFAYAHPNVQLADWKSAIASHIDVLAADQIHPGPTGGAIYARSLTSALALLHVYEERASHIAPRRPQ